MKNTITCIREEILQYFDEKGLINDEINTTYSPDNKYFFRSFPYRQCKPDCNWIVTKIEVWNNSNGKKIFDFIRSDDSLFHCWIKTEKCDYLFLSEDLEGQSVWDLTNHSFSSFSSESDRFIWIDYYPSPNHQKMAIIGCYWGCVSELVIYDIVNPLEIPFRILYRERMSGNSVRWVGNDKICILFPDGSVSNVKGFNG